MIPFQTFLIAIGLALTIGLSGGGYAAYSYQTNKYERIIADANAKQDQIIADAASKALKTEREHAEAVAKFSADYQQQSKELASIRSSLDRLRGKYDGLWVKSTACQAGSSPPASTADGTESTDSTAPAGQCKLDAEFADSLIAAYAAADELTQRAILAQKYAEEIEKYRQERMNEQ